MAVEKPLKEVLKVVNSNPGLVQALFLPWIGPEERGLLALPLVLAQPFVYFQWRWVLKEEESKLKLYSI